MPRKPKKRRTALSRKPAFLAAFAVCASIREAARAAKIDRSQHYRWLEKDPKGKYRAAFEAAAVRAAQSLEDEAVERASVGVYEPLVYQGAFQYEHEYEDYEVTPAIPAGDWKDIGADGRPVPETPAVMGRRIKSSKQLGVWRKSDGLLMFMLRGLKPEKFRIQNVEVTGKDGAAIAQTLTVRFVKPDLPGQSCNPALSG